MGSSLQVCTFALLNLWSPYSSVHYVHYFCCSVSLSLASCCHCCLRNAHQNVQCCIPAGQQTRNAASLPDSNSASPICFFQILLFHCLCSHGLLHEGSLLFLSSLNDLHHGCTGWSLLRCDSLLFGSSVVSLRYTYIYIYIYIHILHACTPVDRSIDSFLE